jgi:phenylalanyl-tRNA synthetase beta chain
MQFPESWLRSFCNPPITSQALAELLTMAGMEVEEARPAAPPFSQVVVAQVLSVERHPNADRLNVCVVDAGGGARLNIVCGAPNVRAGIKVPCALVGAELPPGEDGKPFVIKHGKLRGVDSEGMLCSARELKLSDDHGGLLVLDETATVGQDIREHLQLDDTIFTLKLTPNLAHSLSVYGIAREVAALTGAPLHTPAIAAVPARHQDTLPVDVQAPDLCGRFSGRIVRNVNPKASTPAWMVERLARCGQRSVTALVDISNYVMFEFGRPSHIFDLDKIHGGLSVRWGRAGESLKLLNGSTIEVDAQVGVIADAQAVESLAGIMGGESTAVSDAPLQFRHRRRPSFRAWRRPGVDGGAHRAHHPTGDRHLRRRCRANRRQGAEPAAADARVVAGGARGQGHRHAGDAGAVRVGDAAARPGFHQRAGAPDGHAAELAL